MGKLKDFLYADVIYVSVSEQTVKINQVKSFFSISGHNKQGCVVSKFDLM